MQYAFVNNVHCSSTRAVHAYDRAVDIYMHAIPGVFESKEEALTHDPRPSAGARLAQRGDVARFLRAASII